MSEDGLEREVELFLERRDREPELTAEAWAAGRADGAPGLLAALRSALSLEAQLREGAPARGEYVGPYRVLRLLGLGGMSQVHEVERDGRRFALKRLHPALDDARARERFLREARLLARLEHPGIVRAIECGEFDGTPCLVLELVEGRRLLEYAAHVDLARALELALELCEAVAAVHDAGLLHRDLKPQNVLVRDDGRCVLVDFGLGSSADEAALTSTGDLLGTPRYMAPEQALGRATDERTDVWGLGQVLFELFTGRPSLDEGSREALLRAIAAGRLRRPREVAAHLPADLDRVLRVALARRPSRRYASARELAADLRAVQRGERARARPPGALARACDHARERPWLAAGLAALLTAAAAVPLWLSLERRAEARARDAAARRHLERALVAWTQGEDAGAARELEAADVARDVRARALGEILAGAQPADGGDWPRALAALERGEAALALPHLRVLSPGDDLALALEARARRLAGEPDLAERSLTELERRAPDSLLGAAERSALWLELGRDEDAERELRRAAALAPDAAWPARALAEELLAQDRVREGVEVARAAAALEAHPGGLARLLARGEPDEALRDELERRLALDPAESDSRFALAVLLDGAHLVQRAAAAYEELLAREPDHGLALIYLAHLRAGADRKRCEACARVFELDPTLIDRARAGELLARAVRADRGRDADLLRTTVYLARDHELADEVVAALESALAAEPSPTARARLGDALAGLRREP